MIHGTDNFKTFLQWLAGIIKREANVACPKGHIMMWLFSLLKFICSTIFI